MPTKTSARAKPVSGAPKRKGSRAVEAEILATARGLKNTLHKVGAVSGITMREVDRLFLSLRPAYGGAEVRRIRTAAKMSQPVFAWLLGVEKSAVAQWEQGTKRPSGPVSRLLEVLDPEKGDSPVVQVRRSMTASSDVNTEHRTCD